MNSSLKRYGIAICGLGRAGTIHTGNCYRNPRIKIKYFVEIDLDRANRIKSEFGLSDTEVVHADDITRVLADQDVDGVIVATVSRTHEDLVNKCIVAGKAIFCEKPIALSLEKTISCYDRAEHARVPLFCAFNRRFDQSHSKLQQSVRSGAVGNVHMVRCVSRDSPLPSDDYLKISGGFFHDSIVHNIDMITWILGEYPLSVFSHAHAFRESIAAMGDFDTVSISMKFPSGCLAQIDVSRFASYGYDQRVEVFGEFGMLESVNHHKTSVVKSDHEGVTKDLVMHSFLERFQDSYASELDHFLDVIDGAAPLVAKRNVVMVSLIATACEASQKAGKAMNILEDTLSFEATK